MAKSIWEKLAAAFGNASIDVAMGSRFGGGEAYDSPNKCDWPVDDALPFTVGMIMLGAKMARADGVVTKDEVRAFKKAFKVSDAEMRGAARVFNLAKQDTTGYETCAEQLVTALKGDRKMLEYVLEGLFHIAKADEVLHLQEEKFLGKVAKHLGFTDAEFACMKARHTLAHERNPYEVLGVKPSVNDEELKKQHRRLIGESQDDFTARRLPKEFVLIATAKRAAIQEAYEVIAGKRNLS
jgi:DnaJ like chaperone protein